MLLIPPTHPVTFLSLSISSLLFPPFLISGPCTLHMHSNNTTRDTVGPRHLSVAHRLGHHHRRRSWGYVILGMRVFCRRRSRMIVYDGSVCLFFFSSLHLLKHVGCECVCVREIITVASYSTHSPCHVLISLDFLSSPYSLPSLGTLHPAHAHARQHHS